MSAMRATKGLPTAAVKGQIRVSQVHELRSLDARCLLIIPSAVDMAPRAECLLKALVAKGR